MMLKIAKLLFFSLPLFALSNDGASRSFPFSIISVSVDSNEFYAPSNAGLFYEENKLYGSTGCNNYFGEFKQNENTITIFNVGSTRKLCDDNANEFERVFLSVFSDEFEITNEGSDYFLKSHKALIKLKQNS